MEEKKLTDEDIVKALENCKNLKGCCFCTLWKEVRKGNHCRDLSIDFIRRLQERVFDYDNLENHAKKLELENIGQKAEIERLKMSQKFIVTKGGRDYGKTAHFKIIDYDRLKAENDELQKQVDELAKPIGKFRNTSELQKEYKSLKKEFKKQSQRIKELQKNNDDLKEQSLLKCEFCPARRDLGLLLYQEEQAVKDTAKEILEWLEKHCFFNGFDVVETYFRERFDVEAE